MATGFKEISSQKRKTDFLLATGLSLLALAAYALTLSKGAYPGESARLMATYSGLTPLELPLHPLWGSIVSWLSSLSVFTLPVRLNLFSTFCTVIAVGLLYRLVTFLIHELIYEEYSVEYAARVSQWAGAVAALAFMFSVPVWQAATRLQYQSFNMLLALAAASLLISYAATQWRVFLVLFALLQGVGVVESVMFIPLAPMFLVFLVFVLWKNGQLSLQRIAWMGLLSAAGLSLYYFAARGFLATHDAEALCYATAMDVIVAVSVGVMVIVGVLVGVTGVGVKVMVGVGVLVLKSETPPPPSAPVAHNTSNTTPAKTSNIASTSRITLLLRLFFR